MRNEWGRVKSSQLQTEVNTLAWQNNDFSCPNPSSGYQESAMIALCTGYTIEGRDTPLPNSQDDERWTVTHFVRTNTPEQLIVWEPNNFPFVGEDIPGTMGCYLCGGRHYTSEHRSIRPLPTPAARNEEHPPPNYQAASVRSAPYPINNPLLFTC